MYSSQHHPGTIIPEAEQILARRGPQVWLSWETVVGNGSIRRLSCSCGEWEMQLEYHSWLSRKPRMSLLRHMLDPSWHESRLLHIHVCNRRSYIPSHPSIWCIVYILYVCSATAPSCLIHWCFLIVTKKWTF